MTTMANPTRGTSPAAVNRNSSRASGAYWAWVGAHGGAGVTTLCQAVPGGTDLGRNLPVEEGFVDLPAVVVCRSNASGLAAARDTAAMAAGTTTTLGLVVVADMPERRRPKVLAESLYLTRGAFGDRVWEMPWVEAWRLGEPPSPHNSPPAVRDLLRGLWIAVDLPLPGGSSKRSSTK
jgi:hypothetical protein